jgi:hypothetical protein
VGRAAASVDETRLAQEEDRVGFVDDFIIDPDYRHLADVLIGRCLSVLRKSGVSEVVVRSHGFPALAAEDFAESPPADLPCNPPWYIELFEREGFIRHKEWANFRFPLPSEASAEGIVRWESLLARTGMRVGPVNVRSRRELEQFSNLAYDVLADHYGYTPSRFMDSYSLTKHLLLAVAYPVVRSRIHVLRNGRGDTIGFLSYHPDYRIATKRVMRHLRRVPFPLTILAVPPAVATYVFLVRRTKKATLGAIGLGEEWRGRGFLRAIDYGLKMIKREGYEQLDTGPVLVENAVVIKMAESFATRYGVRMERARYFTLRCQF